MKGMPRRPYRVVSAGGKVMPVRFSEAQTAYIEAEAKKRGISQAQLIRAAVSAQWYRTPEAWTKKGDPDAVTA